MKKTIIAVIALAVLLFAWILLRETQSFFGTNILPQGSSSAGSNESEWVSYTSPNTLFSVSFPKQPTFKTEIERDADGFAKRTNETYVAEDKNDNLYSIYFIRYLSNGSQLPLPPNTLLNNLMYEILDVQQGSQLLGFKRIQFKGKNGLEFSIEKGNILMEALAFTNNSDLYLLSVVGDHDKINPKDFDKFIKSFEFKE